MDWYYAENEQQQGPVDDARMIELIREGRVTRSTLVWRTGMPDWGAAGATDLADHFRSWDEPHSPPPDLPASTTERERNPYAPPAAPSVPARLSTIPTTGAVPRREIPLVVLLMIVTLGIYVVYLLYRWAQELNVLHGRDKYSPGLVLGLTIVTFCIAGVVFEILYAFDLEKEGERRNMPNRLVQLGMIVLGLNLAAIILPSITGGALAFLLWIGGIVATCLVQAEFNKFADLGQEPYGAISYR